MTNRIMSTASVGGVHYLNSAVDATPTEFSAQSAACFDKSKALKFEL